MTPARQHSGREGGRDGGRFGGSRWLALAVFLCALAGGLYLRRSGATHAVEIDARSAAPPRAFELAPFPDDAPRRLSPPAAPPLETRAEGAAAPTAAPRERLALAGWVLEADGQGLGGAAVLVRGRTDPELSGKATRPGHLPRQFPLSWARRCDKLHLPNLP